MLCGHFLQKNKKILKNFLNFKKIHHIPYNGVLKEDFLFEYNIYLIKFQLYGKNGSVMRKMMRKYINFS